MHQWPDQDQDLPLEVNHIRLKIEYGDYPKQDMVGKSFSSSL